MVQDLFRQITAQWLHIKPTAPDTENPALTFNMTSVCGLRAGRALSEGTGFKCRATSKEVEQKQLTCEWHSGQIWRQVMHGGRTFLPMIACFTQTTMGPGRKRRGALCSQQLRALPWQMHCRHVQWFLWHFKLCWSLRKTWQLIQDATTTYIEFG